MAAPTTVLTVIKRFTYRANAAEEWSNTYAFSGTTPADSAAWRALFDLLVTQEKTLYKSSSSVVAGYGYDKIPSAPGDHAIWTVDMTVSPNSAVPGTLTATAVAMAGDQAAWVRWGLDRYNTNGKRVYLRKYFHDGQVQTGGGDALQSGYSTALLAFGNKMIDGTFASGRKLVSKDGEIPIGTAVGPYVTTRTLKRRGKRPPS
jgi:hypothetical protein